MKSRRSLLSLAGVIVVVGVAATGIVLGVSSGRGGQVRGVRSVASTTQPVAADTGPATSAGALQSGCRAAQLRVRLGAFGGAGGEEGQAVLFVNVGPSTCFLDGYPGLSVSSAVGHGLPVRHVTHTYLGAHRVGRIRLGPGKTASALYDWQDSPGAGPRGGCVEVVRVRIRLSQGAKRSPSWSFSVNDLVCQGAVNLLPYVTGAHPSSFGS